MQNDEQPQPQQPKEVESPLSIPDATTSSLESTTSPTRKRRVLFASLILVCLALATGGVLYTTLFRSNQQAAIDKKASSLLGAEARVVDGIAEYSTDNINWKVLKAGGELAQGAYVRTVNDGRVVVALDDGSAIRINGTSIVRLTSLSANDVVISNESGEVYTRVVKSDRKFSVVVGDETYLSLGTAYKTVNKPDQKGVEVYESEVMANLAKQKVGEGKRFFQISGSADLVNKVTDIPLDQLEKDAFLQWNLTQDTQSTEFKEKLGYLKKLQEKQTTQTPAESPKPAPTPAPSQTAASFKLSGVKTDTGVKLSWTISGISVTKGFKVLKSLTENPVLGSSDGAYVSDSAARSHQFTVKDGKTYHFRVCVYNGSGCSHYSNNVAVTAPQAAAPPAQPTGSLNLMHTGGNNFGWFLSSGGSVPYGLKLVWSTSPNPTYPGSYAKFYSETSTTSATLNDTTSGQTYYVRVCMYYEGGCINYSNEVSAVMP